MRVSYLAISDRRCTVQIPGCNFNCRGCFSKERYGKGTELSEARLAELIPATEEVMLAGGEPTINRVGLVSLINKLDRKKVILSTNGYLLDQEFLENLSGIKVHIDLKALDPELHIWYTGRDNSNVLQAIRMLYENRFDFEVSTVYIPGVVECAEIEKIAKFISGIGEIDYKIMRYVPVRDFSKRPKTGDIENAVIAAKKYLDNVTSSIDNRSHPVERKIINLIKES